MGRKIGGSITCELFDLMRSAQKRPGRANHTDVGPRTRIDGAGGDAIL